MDYKEKYEQALERARQFSEKPYLEDSAGIVEYIFPELKESEDEEKPNGGIVCEDFNEGDGFYKVNLAYLNKEQVEEIEELVKRWNLQPKGNENESIISDLLGYFDEDKCLKHKVNDIVKWLKTIKPQPRQEWSELDKRIIDNLISQLGNLFTRKLIKKETKDKYVNWLKSLRPQSQWKPSDEQIEALDFAVDCIVWEEFCIKRKVLKGLLEQLRKL